MASFIACYDLTNTSPSPYTSFKLQAVRFGWSETILTNGGAATYLPNTTLYGIFDTLDDAVSALKAARSATEAELRIPVTMPRFYVGEQGFGQVEGPPATALGGLFGINPTR